MKVSEWLNENLDSHGIYDSAAMKLQFASATGCVAPAWPEYTHEETVAYIKARGLGDGPEGVRADGSNIQTIAANELLKELDGGE